MVTADAQAIKKRFEAALDNAERFFMKEGKVQQVGITYHGIDLDRSLLRQLIDFEIVGAVD